jgi:D-aminopeptidase
MKKYREQIMKPSLKYKNIIIVCDIEGSSGCGSYRASSFLNAGWARACRALTRDVAAVVRALFDAGAESVTVKDFHRTGYNLFTELIDKRARIISGYKNGNVPGMGNLADIDAALFIGMHASSGSGGHIAHTLTSRISKLSAGGDALCELQLFSAALSRSGSVPVFFSGCPVACGEAKRAIRSISVYPIERNSASFDAESWREGLARAAVKSLSAKRGTLYNPRGPFRVTMRMRDERSARRLSASWRLERRKDTIVFDAEDISGIYDRLSVWLYITPFIRKILPVGLFLYSIMGRFGILWARVYLAFDRAKR